MHKLTSIILLLIVFANLSGCLFADVTQLAIDQTQLLMHESDQENFTLDDLEPDEFILSLSVFINHQGNKNYLQNKSFYLFSSHKPIEYFLTPTKHELLNAYRLNINDSTTFKLKLSHQFLNHIAYKENGKWHSLPLQIHTDNSDKAVYIGSYLYSLDEYSDIESIHFIDLYKQHNQTFKERFGDNLLLNKSLRINKDLMIQEQKLAL